MTGRGRRIEKRYLTCKSDDVQRYAIHGSQNIRRHAVGWAIVNLRLPNITHLLALRRSGACAKADDRRKV